jgi:hypothetical protein
LLYSQKIIFSEKKSGRGLTQNPCKSSTVPRVTLP